MKRLAYQVFTTIILIFSATAVVSAQNYENPPVEISKEKLRVGGQICYSHIVLEKQTLYSICKAYGVTQEDIYKYNPGVKEGGLKKNSILVIPVVEKKEDVAVVETAKPEVVTEEVLAENKTEVSVAQSQPNEKPQEQKPQAETKKRKVHTAKWFEDIYGIAERYGVTVNAIMQANGLTSEKLSKRQKLIIPFPGEYPDIEIPAATEEDKAIAEEVAGDSTSVADSVEQERGFFEELFFPKKEVNMSLLLPLQATGASSSKQNMDFYSGVLMAVHDVQKEGVTINLDVHDITNGNISESMESIGRSDIILGPVASGDISRLAEALPDAKAIVSPLDPRAESLVSSRKSVIQAPTPHHIQYNDLVSWIKEELMPEDRVIFITEKGARQSDAITSMTVAIDSSGIAYHPLSYSILEGRNVTDNLAFLMTETAVNRVYIASDSEAFVNDVVRNLNVMIHKKYNVVLYAPARIRGYETIEVENFHNTLMRVSTGYYIDYEDTDVKDFLLKYRALFGAEPTQFAFQGYDTAKHFIMLCHKYGNRWTEKIDEVDNSMLQSTFDFIQTPEGGCYNSGIRRIVYGPEWTVEKVK